MADLGGGARRFSPSDLRFLKLYPQQSNSFVTAPILDNNCGSGNKKGGRSPKYSTLIAQKKMHAADSSHWPPEFHHTGPFLDLDLPLDLGRRARASVAEAA